MMIDLKDVVEVAYGIIYGDSIGPTHEAIQKELLSDKELAKYLKFITHEDEFIVYKLNNYKEMEVNDNLLMTKEKIRDFEIYVIRNYCDATNEHGDPAMFKMETVDPTTGNIYLEINCSEHYFMTPADFYNVLEIIVDSVAYHTNARLSICGEIQFQTAIALLTFSMYYELCNAESMLTPKEIIDDLFEAGAIPTKNIYKVLTEDIDDLESVAEMAYNDVFLLGECIANRDSRYILENFGSGNVDLSDIVPFLAGKVADEDFEDADD